MRSLALKTALRVRGWAHLRAFDRSASSPRETQQRLLFTLLRENSQTVFGSRHGFNNINDEATYRRRVPVQDYQAFLPYIQELQRGTPAVLTADPVVRFNLTSGTTGTPKLIPVTARSARLSSQLLTQWLYRACRDHPLILEGASLLVAGAAVEGATESSIPVGSATGLLHQRLPVSLRETFAFPSDVSMIKDYDLRYYLYVRFALGRSVSLIATPNPSTIVRLAEVARSYQETVIHAIADGTLWGSETSFDAGPQVREIAALERCVGPDPNRARFLLEIVKRRGYLRLGDCWPSLALIGCWLGGSVGYQAEKLREHFGSTVPIRDLGFQASEGSFTIPCEDGTAAGVLAIQNNYYEFVPETDLERENPSVLSVDELEEGQQYAMVLTSPSGLYRYNIQDIVQVTGRYRRTPVLAFVRKSRDMANITGEKLHVNHLVEAMNRIRERHGFVPSEFRAVPNVRESRYDIYVRRADGLSDVFVRDTLIPSFDAALAEINIEYREKRRSKRLRPPCVYLMRDGWEQEDRRRAAAKAQRDAQYKWRVLIATEIPEEREFVCAKVEWRDGGP